MMQRALDDVRSNLDYVGCDNATALELCAEIERLTAENERLRAALENIVGAYAHDHHNCTAESLREIAARAINQQSECSRCGGTKVEKATAGDGYHPCPDCAP